MPNGCLSVHLLAGVPLPLGWSFGRGRSGAHTVALHDLEELGDDLGGRADHDLALAGLLGVVDVLESIVEDGSLDHFGGCRREILKSWK